MREERLEAARGNVGAALVCLVVLVSLLCSVLKARLSLLACLLAYLLAWLLDVSGESGFRLTDPILT